MKKLWSLAALAILVSLAPVSVKAGDDHDGDHPKWKEKVGEMHEKRLEMMTKKLKLTPEQQNTVKGILDDQSQKMEANFREASEKRKALREETDTKIKAALTDQQKADYDKMQEEMKKKMEERRESHKEHKSDKKK